MKICAIIFLLYSVTFSTANKIDDATKYVDEVLSVYVPRAVEEADLEIYDMPHFTSNFQNRSHDGTATTGKIFYYSGNLTGLQTVRRKSCNEPSWTSGNITVHCIVVVPKISVQYEARIQVLTSLSNNVRFQQKDFSLHGDIVDMEVALDITASPYVTNPCIKSLRISQIGTPSLRFSDVEIVSYEVLSSHFYHKYSELFEKIFYDMYRNVYDKAVGSIPYPF